MTLKDFFGDQNAFDFCNVIRQRENNSLEDDSVFAGYGL